MTGRMGAGVTRGGGGWRRWCILHFVPIRFRPTAPRIATAEWPEVKYINGYAVLLGYLSMMVRGLGFLVVTWTTVVLLGGFVSMLGNKDFWCLSAICFVQIVGVIDFVVGEKFTNVNRSVWGILAVTKILTGNWLARRRPVSIARCVLAFLQGLLVVVLIVCLLPISAIFDLGVYTSAAVSLWRLIQRDYGNADGDPAGRANMTPALDILYSLLLVQAALFCYKRTLLLASRGIVRNVAGAYKFRDAKHRSVLWHYFRDMELRCDKNPSLEKGRNLITHAVDLMGSPSSSPDDYLVGVRILDMLIRSQGDWITCQDMLMRHLIVSASSRNVLETLLHVLAPRSQYHREVRLRAASIVAHLADDICLENFPQGIQCISSLIDTFQEYRQQALNDGDENDDDDLLPSKCGDSDHRTGYKVLVVQGMRILQKLAADENNTRIMCNTPGLLPKIMAPVAFDLLHRVDADEWFSIVEGSLGLMRQLVASPGEIGAKLRHEISSSKEAIRTMKRILGYDKCYGKLKIQIMGIFTQLYMNTESGENFIKDLVVTFIDNNKISTESIRKSAGEALAMLSLRSPSNATIILQVNGDVVCTITKILLDVENKRYRISAAEILEHLCCHYNKDDEYLKKLKETMVDVMPKVLGEILCCGLARSETNTGAEDDRVQLVEPASDTELEAALLAALLSLCVTVCDTFISPDQDLARQFDAIDAVSIPWKLKEMVEKNSDLTVDCLRVMKLTSKIVISMMKHRGSYIKQDLESLMEVLSSASKNMFLLDGSMVFTGGDDGSTALASLVYEAQELVEAMEPSRSVAVQILIE